MRRRTALMWMASVAFALAVSGGAASAGPVTPTDLDGITLGASMLDPGAANLIPYVGQIDMQVFYNSGTGVYTYQIIGLPDAGAGWWANQVITPTNLYGFNGVAGWSYSDVVAAGGPGDATAWSIDWSLNDRLTWSSPVLDSSASMRFFYQSTHSPTNFTTYVLGVRDGDGVSSGWAFGPKPQETAPVVTAMPEPAGLGLVGLAALAWRKRRR
jgi:hypothetical protein